ncbi:hypothetical protein ZIOFF_063639 [Zingiber officinale]|uniref:Uncharacterized protein n=1 Tax=Zingiber officinale TaxID=94328 RepID=A0A8J5KBC2_ZINOF|nr:hypothetical protein ZIOFF_063639 [Zingiber officinale]
MGGRRGVAFFQPLLCLALLSKSLPTPPHQPLPLPPLPLPGSSSALSLRPILFRRDAAAGGILGSTLVLLMLGNKLCNPLQKLFVHHSCLPWKIVLWFDLPFSIIMQGFLRVEVGTNEMPCNFIASDVKENLSTPMSSRIPSMDSFMAEAMEFQTDGVREPSIEKLYYNVCELEGSYDGSVSWQSYGSDSEESRIDSELCHLVGGQAIRAIEAQEDRNITNVVARAKNRPTEKKLESNLKSLSTNTSSGSSKKLKRPPQLRHNPDKYLKSEIGAVFLLEPALPESFSCPLHLLDFLGRAEAGIELPHLSAGVIVGCAQPGAAALRDLESPHCQIVRTARGFDGRNCRALEFHAVESMEEVASLFAGIENDYLKLDIHVAKSGLGSAQKDDKTIGKGGLKSPQKDDKTAEKNGLRSPQKDDKTVENRGYVVGHMKKQNKHPTKEANSDTGSDDLSEGRLDNPDLGPFLLKHAKDLIASNNQEKALKYALRAAKSFQKCTGVKPSLDLVMSLHVVAAIYCNLGKFAEAVPVLQQSVKIPVPEESQEHALAKFSGYMQLGDTYAMLGLLESSIYCYEDGLEIQRQALGDMDPRVGETCRYLAEAHVQALQFEQAERLCQKALDIHKANGETTSVEEAADRRLMALIYDTKGDHEAALEHLVLASMGLVSNGQETEVASVDISIGDIYLSLARYEEAVFAYRKALTAFKASKGENHPAVASVFVRLADLHNRIGKFGESKCYCESALRIYNKPIPGSSSEEIATGFTNVSSIFESMNENEQALKLLQKAVKMYKNCPGQQSTIAGIEAQIGVLHYIIGNYEESYLSLENAITKLRACGEKKSAFFGVVLNQMGLACIQSFAISEAAKFFDEARSILEQECGPYHLDTLGVYSNLAGAYDAMGRFDEAIEILKYVVGLREEKLGTASPDVSDEKRRLAELLKENGRVRNRKSRSLETLFDKNAFGKKKAVASAV